MMSTARTPRAETRRSAARAPSSSSEGYTLKKNGERRARSGADADGEINTRPSRSATGSMTFASADVTPPMTMSAPASSSASHALAARVGSDPESR